MSEISRIGNFVRTLSTDRFNRYLSFAQGNTDKALDLYSYNASLSQALYVPLQALEVTLRNSIHECLKKELGDYWFDRPDMIKVKHQMEQIGEAKARLVQEEKSIMAGQVVAGLPFGFWTSMFKPNYEDLWRQHLHDMVVPEKKNRMTRKAFSGPLEAIRIIRNRIAHHECILTRNLENHYSSIRNLLDLLAPEARYWMEKHSIFEDVYKKQKSLLDDLHNEKGNKGSGVQTSVR